MNLEPNNKSPSFASIMKKGIEQSLGAFFLAIVIGLKRKYNISKMK